MAQPHHVLTPRRGFSLIEVLVALSLVAVLGTAALMLLESARRVSGQVADARPDPMRAVVDRLRGDLDHLIPAPAPESLPRFTLENGTRLAFTTRVMDREGRRIAAEVVYHGTPEHLLRIQRLSLEETPVTNRLDIAPVRFAARYQEQWLPSWPPEETGDGPPAILRVVRNDGEAPFSHDLFLPASLKIEN